jgi:acetone carboxylase gamma subunit
LRRERLDGTDPKVDTRERSSIPASDARLSEYLQVTDAENGSSVQCTWCGEQICSGSGKWKDNVASRKVSIAESGPHRKDVNQFFMLEYFCPSCATQLDVDVIYRDDPPIYDDIRRWPE